MDAVWGGFHPATEYRSQHAASNQDLNLSDYRSSSPDTPETNQQLLGPHASHPSRRYTVHGSRTGETPHRTPPGNENRRRTIVPSQWFSRQADAQDGAPRKVHQLFQSTRGGALTITLLSTAATALTAVVNIGPCIAVASVEDRIPDGINNAVILNRTAAMTACSSSQGGQVKGHSIKRGEMATRTVKHLLLKWRRVPLTTDIIAPPSVRTPRRFHPNVATRVRAVPTSRIHAPLPSEACLCGNGTLGRHTA